MLPFLFDEFLVSDFNGHSRKMGNTAFHLFFLVQMCESIFLWPDEIRCSRCQANHSLLCAFCTGAHVKPEVPEMASCTWLT